MKPLYPLKFEPIFQDRIWGGQKLQSVLAKALPGDSIGESWEISTVPGNTSIVSEGPLKGTSLQNLVEQYGKDLIGEKNQKRFGHQFPLLIKFLDAQKPLSIQLHPNDELARQRHNSFGKTEMWYVLQADKDAELIVGFNQKMTKEKYVEALEAKKLPSILNVEKVKKGDTFFIEVGRIHAIGAGCMIAEIQQTSDITYRLYDWDRVDAQGKSRELHTTLALDAINFDMDDDFQVRYEKDINTSNVMVQCPYFTTNFIPLEGSMTISNTYDSFMIYMCVAGQASLKYHDNTLDLNKGETVLIPAVLKNFEFVAESAQLLEVYV